MFISVETFERERENDRKYKTQNHNGKWLVTGWWRWSREIVKQSP